MAICGIYIVFSILHLMSLFTDGAAILVGGFSATTKVISGVVGACGVVFGMIGFLGAYDRTPAYLRAFFYFMVAEIVVSMVIYAVDMIELRECEAWVSGVQRHVAYNPAMDEIAQRGECSYTRVSYSISWVIDFVIGSYFAYVIWCYSRGVDQKAAYSIHFDTDAHPTKFVAEGVNPGPVGYGSVGDHSVPQIGQPEWKSAPPGAYYGGESRPNIVQSNQGPR